MVRTLVAAFILTACATAGDTDPRPVAVTLDGDVRGVFQDGVEVYKGLPYGADTSSRRFQRAIPPSRWTGVRDAREFGPIAPQGEGHVHSAPSFYPSEALGTPQSEDCLRLNVWTPAQSGHRPVLVWFHGGGYNGWSANVDLYDGTALCRKGDVVVVTVNHRLNGFGFLDLESVLGPAYADSGNAGMLDLVMALKWVHANIARFGGDPSCVTLFGQSGGGAKCATLMAMPEVRGLFQRVWTMSGQQLTGRARMHAEATTRSVLAKLGLDDTHADSLATLPMARLLQAFRGETFTPVVDGKNLPRDPFSPDASPLSADVPMVLGNTHDETTYLIGSSNAALFSLTWEELPAALERNLKPFIGTLTGAQIAAKYRSVYPTDTPSQVFFAASTAARSWKGMVLEAERRAAQDGAKTYVYEFDWKSPIYGGSWGAPHTIDIPFVFDNLAKVPSMVGSAAQGQGLADRVSAALIAFARTGSPSTPTLRWAPFTLTRRETMRFDTESGMAEDPRSAERKYFEPVDYIQPGS